MAVGAGDAVIDYAMPEPEPPPLTTIAWRMGHIADRHLRRAGVPPLR